MLLQSLARVSLKICKQEMYMLDLGKNQQNHNSDCNNLKIIF